MIYFILVYITHLYLYTLMRAQTNLIYSASWSVASILSLQHTQV